MVFVGEFREFFLSGKPSEETACKEQKEPRKKGEEIAGSKVIVDKCLLVVMSRVIL